MGGEHRSPTTRGPESFGRISRTDQVMKGPVAHQRAGCCVLRAGYWVLHAGCCSRARTCAHISDGPRGLLWSPLRLGLRLPAPSCCALKSAAETPLPSHPRPARDRPRTTPVCSCARCRWLGSSSKEQSEAIFWADLQKISTRGVITMLKHPSHPCPPHPSPFFLYGLDFLGRADANRTLLLTWPHLCGRGDVMGRH